MVSMPLVVLGQDYEHDIAISALDLSQRTTDNSSGLKSSAIAPRVPSYGETVFSLGHPGGSKENFISQGELINPIIAELKADDSKLLAEMRLAFMTGYIDRAELIAFEQRVDQMAMMYKAETDKVQAIY